MNRKTSIKDHKRVSKTLKLPKTTKYSKIIQKLKKLLENHPEAPKATNRLKITPKIPKTSI